jgi:PHD/YefM family antitoxin component YafN of YafNO toxin-antitoxin module
MIDLSKDIDSLSNFKRKTPDFLQRMRKSGRPVVLTINGKAELIVQDAASYQQLLELVDRLEAVKGIQRGLEDMAQGKSKPIAKIRQEKKKKYGL